MLCLIPLLWNCLGFPIRPSDAAATVYLSAGETALLSASSYFTGSASDFYTRGEAAVLKESALEETLRVEVDSAEWRVGAVLKHHAEVFFAVLGTDWVEVWRWRENTVAKDWRVPVTRRIAKATGVSISTPGFVLTTAPPIEVFFVPISPTPQLTPISSIDTAGATHVSVCSEVPKLATLRDTPAGEEITTYDLDYLTLIVQRRYGPFLYRLPAPIVDVGCILVYRLLTATAIYEIDDERIWSLPIAPAMGAGIKLLCVREYSLFSVTTERGVLLWTPYNTYSVLPKQFFPGAVFATVVSKHEFTIDSFNGCWSIVVRSHEKFKNIERYWYFPIPGTVDDILWPENAHGSDSYSLLLKQGSALVELQLTLKDTYAIAPASALPYTFALCAVDQLDAANSACRNLTVIAVPFEDSVVLVNCTIPVTACGEEPIEISVPYEGQNTLYIFDSERWLSGANFQYSITFPTLPKGVKVSVSEFLTEIEGSNHSFPSTVNGFQFLCRSLFDIEYRHVFVRASNLAVVVENDKVQVISMNRTASMCIVDNLILCICGIDSLGKNSLLCSFLDMEFIPQPIETPCIAMKDTRTHVLVVLQSGLFIMEKLSKHWSRVQTRSTEPLTGLWTNEYSFIVYSKHSLELFEWRSQRFISTLFAPTSTDLSLLTFFESALVAVSSAGECTVYRISTARQLIKRYILSLSCHATGISISSHYAYLRCNDHFQLISLVFPRRSSKVRQLYRPEFPSVIFTTPFNLEEVYCSESECRSTTWLDGLANSHEKMILFHISDENLLSDTISLAGILQVVAASNESATIALNFAIAHNYKIAVIPPSNRGIPARAIEVPWTQAYSFPLSALFSGHNLTFAATVRHSVGLEVVTPHYLQLPHQPQLFSVAGELGLVFYLLGNWCFAERFKCSKHTCGAVAESSLYLSELLIASNQLEVLLTTESFVYLQITYWGDSDKPTIGRGVAIVVYDSQSQRFEVAQNWMEWQKGSTHHVIQTSDKETIVFFYFSILRMCTVIGKSFTCTDVNELGLEGVISVSSEQLSSSTWRVYFLTDILSLYQYLFAGSLVFERKAEVPVPANTFKMWVELVGNRAILLLPDRVDVYSLSTFKKVSSLPISPFTYSTSYWRRSKPANISFLAIGIQESKSSFAIIDLGDQSDFKVLAGYSASFLQFTSPTDIAYIKEETLYMVKLSQVVLTLQRNESEINTVESEVYVTATNAHSNVTCTLQVIRTGEKRYTVVIGLVVLSAVLCAAYLWKKRRVGRTESEVEMEAIALE